jgi:hypothetical protein
MKQEANHMETGPLVYKALPDWKNKLLAIAEP